MITWVIIMIYTFAVLFFQALMYSFLYLPWTSTLKSFRISRILCKPNIKGMPEEAEGMNFTLSQMAFF